VFSFGSVLIYRVYYYLHLFCFSCMSHFYGG
jgi:hypothetical protein